MRFDIRRDPNPRIAFGWGEHFCLGAQLARMEARIFWEEFFRAFRSVELTGPVRRMRSNAPCSGARIGLCAYVGTGLRRPELGRE